MNNFNPFFFDGNLYWGPIRNENDLNRLFNAYSGNMTSSEILNCAICDVDEVDTFSLKSFSFSVSGSHTIKLKEHLAVYIRSCKIEKILEDGII
jgi:hypothetical protein